MSVLCDSICREQAYMRAKFDIIRLCMWCAAAWAQLICSIPNYWMTINKEAYRTRVALFI